jgi:hypothetical protein
MDDLTKAFLGLGDSTVAFTPLDVIAVFGTSVALTLFVAWAYRSTHRGVSYSQSFAHTLVILGVAVAFFMLIIGANVARAFTLVGALSIIRFRHAVKETRDIGFVFVSLAVGMACGTRSYLLAGFATVSLIGVIVLLHRLSLFRKVIRERILIVRVGAAEKPEEVFAEMFRRHLDEHHLISVESVDDERLQELIYSVVLRRRAEPAQLLADLRAVNGNQKVSLVIGQQELDL